MTRQKPLKNLKPLINTYILPHKFPVAIIAIFAVIGIVALARSHAATYSVAMEAEGGAISGSAASEGTTGASSSAAVKFGSGGAAITPVPAATMTITVNGGTKGPVMDGFGIAANSASWKNGELKPVIDKYLAENGASIWRVILDEEDWETTNDNSDPNVYDTAAYNKIFSSPKFEDLWAMIAYLNSKGVTDLLEVSFMGQSPDWMGGFDLGSNMQDEYAETMAAAVQYGYKTRGLKFGLFSPNNEPQSPSFVEGTRMSDSVSASVYAKIATKMNADGLTSVKLVGPESTTVGAATNSGMAAAFRNNSTVMAKLGHFAGHLYANSIGSGDSSAIKSVPSTASYWMTEFGPPFDSSGTPFDAFWGQMTGGPSGFILWEGYDSVYNHAIRNNLGSAPGNDDGGLKQAVNYNASTKTYTYNKDFYQLGQVWRFVRPGMQYIASTSSNNSVSTRAYMNTTNNTFTLVGRNTSSTSQVIGVTLSGTPAVSRLRYYDTTGNTTSSGNNIKQGVDALVTDNNFRAAIPANSVFTLTNAGN